MTRRSQVVRISKIHCWPFYVLFFVMATSSMAPGGAQAQGLHPFDEADEEEPEAPTPFGPGFSKRFGRGLLLERLRTGAPQDQIDAARELGRRQDEGAVPGLLEMLEGASSGHSATPTEAIIQALGEIGDRRAVPALLNLLTNRGSLQRASIQALGRLGDERALDPIANLLSRPSLSRDAISALLHLGPRVLMRAVSLLRDPATAGPACELLGRLGDSRALWPMVQALDSPRARVRRQCSAALGQLGDPRSQRALLGLLQDPDASVRRRALAALVSLSDGSMGPALAPLVADEERGARVVPALRGQTAKAAVPALAQMASTDPSPTQQLAIAALGRIGGAESAAVLADLMRSPRGDVRFLAAKSLSQLGPEHGLVPLLRAARTKGPGRIEGLRGLGDLFRPVPMLADEEDVPAEVRELAFVAMRDSEYAVAGAGAYLVGALGDRGDTPQLLIELATSRTEPELRALATSALGSMRPSKACPIVIQALADRNEGVRAAAAWTAGELGCSHAGPLLLAVLERGPDGAAGNAAWALGAVGYDKAAPVLRQRLAEGGPALRANASLALAALGDYRSGAVIRGRMSQEQSSHVKAAMVDALGRLGGTQSLAALERLSTVEGLVGVLASDGLEAIRRDDTLRTPTGSEVFRTRLLDGQGEPLAGIWYTLALPDRRIVGGITDPSGEITITRIPDGRCALGLGRSP